MRRRPYQLGKSAFRVDSCAEGWCVVEEWSEVDRRGERDDGLIEYVAGPFRERAEADAAAKELAERCDGSFG